MFVTAVSVFSSTVVFASDYSDVGLTDKYGIAIDFITQEGVVSGYPDGSFKPVELMNRAELSKILANAFFSVPGGIDSYDNNCFNDVKKGEWYTPYVCFLKFNEVIDGHPDGTFRPSDKVNLVEALKMILEIYKIEYKESTPWYHGIVEKASSGNFISLDFIKFDQKVNRGQMADVTTRVMKYMQYNVDKNYNDLDNYLGFLKNYNVTYSSLENGKNVEEESRDIEKVYDATAVQFEVMNDSSNYQVSVYSSDAIKNETVSCSQGYLSGNFKLSILSTDQSGGRDKILNEIDLGYRTLFPLGATHFVNMNYGEIPLDPLIILEEYGDCNGNLFTFFRPKNYYENFTELEFSNLDDNKIYATSFENIEFDLEAFSHTYYDNAKGKEVTKSYSWDEDVYTFVLD